MHCWTNFWFALHTTRFSPLIQSYRVSEMPIVDLLDDGEYPFTLLLLKTVAYRRQQAVSERRLDHASTT
jgi:hypothetical protein